MAALVARSRTRYIGTGEGRVRPPTSTHLLLHVISRLNDRSTSQNTRRNSITRIRLFFTSFVAGQNEAYVIRWSHSKSEADWFGVDRDQSGLDWWKNSGRVLGGMSNRISVSDCVFIDDDLVCYKQIESNTGRRCEVFFVRITILFNYAGPKIRVKDMAIDFGSYHSQCVKHTSVLFGSTGNCFRPCSYDCRTRVIFVPR